jgi:hypothetical protein
MWPAEGSFVAYAIPTTMMIIWGTVYAKTIYLHGSVSLAIFAFLAYDFGLRLPALLVP